MPGLCYKSGAWDGQGGRLFLAPRNQRPEALVTVVEHDLGRDLRDGDRTCEHRAAGNDECHQESIDTASRAPGDRFHDGADVRVTQIRGRGFYACVPRAPE